MNMTRTTKINILDAYDALTAVASARRPPVITPGGNPARRCDVCDHSTLSRARHPGTCPIGAALAILRPIVPAAADRQAWLNAP